MYNYKIGMGQANVVSPAKLVKKKTQNNPCAFFVSKTAGWKAKCLSRSTRTDI